MNGCKDRIIPTREASASMEKFLDRWDVTVHTDEGSYPSWFEISQMNGQLTGRFVGRVGGVRSMSTIQIDSDALRFTVSAPYDPQQEEIWFRGTLAQGRIEGTTNASDRAPVRWVAVRAPALARAAAPRWEAPIELFDGSDLTGWHVRFPEEPNNWRVEDGDLVNTGAGTDLISDQELMDLELHVEFKYPSRGNSGIYLRGRYEIQIRAPEEGDPSPYSTGAVYSFIAPSKDADKGPGEWQSLDITLLGRQVSVVLDGETIIEDQEIPGITGGALDSSEGKPGPIMLQGSHGPVRFRNIVVKPAQR